MDAQLVVFSRNRAVQADLLLRSLTAHFQVPHRVHLVYRASDADFAAGYARLLRDHPHVEAIDEDSTGIDRSLRGVLEGTSADLFGMLVDDDLLIRNVRPDDAPLQRLASDPSVMTVSLRLAPHKTWSHTHQRPMAVPPLDDGVCDFAPRRAWIVRRHIRVMRGLDRLLRRAKPHLGCWQIPFSVDGNLHRLERFRSFCRRLPPFDHATSVEPLLNRHRAQWEGLLRGAFYPQERLVNLVMNNVDDQGARYPHPGHDPATANTRYLQGERLDGTAYEGGTFKACHVDADPHFVRPGTGLR